MQKKKLELRKKTILTLSDAEKKAIAGGEAITTSFSHCTNVLCCGTGCTTTQTIHTPYPDNCAGNSVPTWCPPA